MAKYTVHLFREMHLTFVGIEADTPEAAAAAVSQKPTEEADNIEDCHGENRSALVDVEGDETFSQSVMIDFEAERSRKAAAKLLATLEAVIDYAENEAYSLEELKDSPEAEIEAEKAWNAVEAGREVIAEAKAAGVPSLPATSHKTGEA
jgi:hypothetical protein